MKKNVRIIKGKIKASTLVISIATLLLVVVSSAVAQTYLSPLGVENGIRLAMAESLRLPAAVVEGKMISVAALQSNLEASRKFYESQDFAEAGLRVDFSTQEGLQRLDIKRLSLLNKMIEDAAVEILSESNGIRISDNEIENSVKAKLEEYGSGEDVERDLKIRYGWDLKDFGQNVVRPAMQRASLQQVGTTESEAANAEALAKISSAKKMLDEGTAFTEVARQYSEGESAKNGGSVGWIGRDQLVSELVTPVFTARSGQRLDVIESELGYHIVEVEDIKKIESDNVVKLNQIFVRKNTFADWLGLKMEEMDIYVPLRSYEWDREQAVAQFADERMRAKEKEIREKSQGDVSVWF